MYNITIKRDTNKEGRTMTCNQRTINVKLERIEICDLLIACTMLEQETDAKKWGDLHDKLMATLEAFDEKNGYGAIEF